MKGLKSNYQLADEFPVLGESWTVLWMGGSGIHRFDYRYNEWVEDREMYSIFIGSPLVAPITEQQARGTIQRNGGRWVTPPGWSDPGLGALDDLKAQMQANADSVPIPEGAETIVDMGTVVPYWLADSSAPGLGKSQTVLWTGGNGVRIWRFDYETDAWVLDPGIPTTFIGTPETMPISEQEARETIERNGGTWEAATTGGG